MSTRQDKMLQPQKCAFWKKIQKVKKITVSHFRTNFHNFPLKIETGWATRMVKLTLKTRNVYDDAC